MLEKAIGHGYFKVYICLTVVSSDATLFSLFKRSILKCPGFLLVAEVPHNLLNKNKIMYG